MTLLNGTDSKVCLGSWAKGRSSAPQLNTVWRQCLGHCVLCSKRFAQFWLPSAQNPSDDPSREVPLRKPKVATGVVARLITPGRTADGCSSSGPHNQRWLVLEVFSGCGRLSAKLANAGLGVAPPLEAYPAKGVYVRASDLLDNDTFDKLLREFSSGAYFYVHFGMPCSSYSILQALNGGTRCSEHPEGDGSLDRENVGNTLARRVARLCRALHDSGCYFSIENPRSSWLWKFSPIARLSNISLDVQFDQCEYQLTPPHLSSHLNIHIKKPTTLRSNLSILQSLSRKCSGLHKHFHCRGSVKTAAGWVSVSKAAGAYPDSLCEQWASLVASAAAAAC